MSIMSIAAAGVVSPIERQWAAHEHEGPLRFERRQSDRWPVNSAATAICISGERFGEMHSLAVLDYSHDGMGAMSETVIEPGEVVSIGFQSPGRLARRGVILRCTPSGQGYRVAVQFENRLAA